MLTDEQIQSIKDLWTGESGFGETIGDARADIRTLLADREEIQNRVWKAERSEKRLRDAANDVLYHRFLFQDLLEIAGHAESKKTFERLMNKLQAAL